MSKRKRRKRKAGSRPSFALYSPLAIFAHTMLFTPLAGGFLVRENYRRLGDEKRARSALLYGIGALLALALAGWLLEKWLGDAARGGIAGGTVAMAMAWYRDQKPHFEKHRHAGGKPASVVKAAMLGTVLVAVSIGTMVWALGIDASSSAYNIGLGAMRAGKHQQAVKEFRKVVAESPDDHAARYGLALALLCLDATDAALGELGKIPADSPVYAQAHALYERGKTGEAALLKQHCR